MPEFGSARYLPVFKLEMAENLASLQLADLAILWCRSLLAKHLGQNSCKGIGTGRFSKERAFEIARSWAVHLNARFEDIDLAKGLGLKLPLAAADSDDVLGEVVDLQHLHEGDHGDLEPFCGATLLQLGGSVVVARRFTRTCPINWDPDYRKDPRGKQGVVRGWADVEHRQVLVAVELRRGGQSHRGRPSLPKEPDAPRNASPSALGNIAELREVSRATFRPYLAPRGHKFWPSHLRREAVESAKRSSLETMEVVQRRCDLEGVAPRADQPLRVPARAHG